MLSEPVLTEAAIPGPAAPEVVIYSSAICPYCVAAKNFLKSKGQAWREVRIDLDAAVEIQEVNLIHVSEEGQDFRQKPPQGEPAIPRRGLYL